MKVRVKNVPVRAFAIVTIDIGETTTPEAAIREKIVAGEVSLTRAPLHGAEPDPSLIDCWEFDYEKVSP